jgi:hypothetical protein
MAEIMYHTSELEVKTFPNGSIINMTQKTNLTEIIFDYEEPYSKEYFRHPSNVIRLVLCTLSILLNSLSLIVVANIHGTYTTHLRLIMSLCISDTLVSLGVLANMIVEAHYYNVCLERVLNAINNTAFVVSLLNLKCMALDHYLAIVRPIHYPIQMTSRRTICIIVILWVISFLVGFSEFFVGLPYYEKFKHTKTFCQFIHSNKFPYAPAYVIFVIIIVCFVLMTFIYSRILLEIQRHRERATNNPDLRRNRKALVTTIIILGTFTICWVPLCLFNISAIIQIKVNRESFAANIQIYESATQYLMNLMLLNAVLDPIIYAVRMREVQRSYNRLSKRCCGMCMKDQPIRSEVHTAVSLLDGHSRSTYRFSDSTRRSNYNNYSESIL